MATSEHLSTRMSTKGQVVLPVAIRRELGWGPGTRLTVEQGQGAVILREGPPVPRTRPEDVRGCLAWRGPAKSLDEMDAGVMAEARRRHAGG